MSRLRGLHEGLRGVQRLLAASFLSGGLADWGRRGRYEAGSAREVLNRKRVNKKICTVNFNPTSHLTQPVL